VSQSTDPSARTGMFPGMRVQVWDGDQTTYLGEGTYEGETTVYVMYDPRVSADNLQMGSMPNAEERPPEEAIPEGWTVYAIENNPKIKLDDGQMVYGCQVWWQPQERRSEVDW
jgi:hypothetical protein